MKIVVAMVMKIVKMLQKHGSRDNSKTIHATSLGMRISGNVLIMHIIFEYLHFHCESLNEPLHFRCGSYLREQIDLSHNHIHAI